MLHLASRAASRAPSPASLALATLAVVLTACNALLDIDGIEFGNTAGAAGTSTAAGGGGAGGHGGSGGAAGDGAAGLGGGAGSGGAGGSPCVFGLFEAPVALEAVHSSYGEWDPAVSSDELTLNFNSTRPGTLGGSDIWYATRANTSADFGTPQNLTEVNSTSGDHDSELSFDGLAIYWASDRWDGTGGFDIWYATRASASETFGTAENLTELNTVYTDRDPALSRDGLTLLFASNRVGGAGDLDIWQATRPSVATAFGTPQNVTEVNGSGADSNVALSSDGLTLYFSSDRTGGVGGTDIWYAERPTTTATFGEPQNLTLANSAYTDSDPTLAANGLTLYFVSTREDGGATSQIYTMTRACQ